MSRLPLIFKRGYVVRPLPRQPDPLKTSKRATTWEVAPGVTFTHRPPPTPPTPFSLTAAPASPLLALGKRDPAASTSSTEDVPLPPALHADPAPKSTLTPEQVAEIRRIRAEDPTGTSASVIAKQFGVSAWYVRMLAPLRKEEKWKVIAEKVASEGREKWGYRKRLIRESRQKRKDYWSMAPPS